MILFTFILSLLLSISSGFSPSLVVDYTEGVSFLKTDTPSKDFPIFVTTNEDDADEDGDSDDVLPHYSFDTDVNSICVFSTDFLLKNDVLGVSKNAPFTLTYSVQRRLFLLYNRLKIYC